MGYVYRIVLIIISAFTSPDTHIKWRELTGDGTTDLAYDGRFELGNFLKANVMRLVHEIAVSSSRAPISDPSVNETAEP